MLWNSVAAEAIEKMFKLAQQSETDARKDSCIKRLSFYHDEMNEYVKDMLIKHHTEPDLFEPCFFNIIKKIINQLAQVYLQDAKRSLADATEQDKVAYLAMVQSSNLNVKMKLADRYTKLLKTILLRPIWRNDRGMDLDILTGDVLDVMVGDVPDELQQVMVTHYPENGKINDVTYSLWSAESFTRLDHNKNVLSKEPNIYGVVPFIPVWDSYPATGSFWLPGGNDLVSVQEAIALKLTDLMLVIEYQGFGTPVMKGMPAGGKMAMGPHNAIECGVDGDFTYAKSNAPIKAILESIQFLAQQAALTNGLSAASMSTKPTQESGLSRISGSAELMELRKDSISLFGRYERQLFDMQKLIWNTHNDKKISDNARLRIDFHDPVPVLSPDKQAELWKAELDMGTLSRLDIIMQKNSDLSREDAQIKLKEIQDENTLYSPAEALNQER